MSQSVHHARAIRTLTLQALYAIDMRQATTQTELAAWFEQWFGEHAASDEDFSTENLGLEDVSESMVDTAIARAFAAYADKDAADAAMVALAPTWPATRQAAVDRAILRLSHYEMTSGTTPAKIVVNEAVELAKKYSTEKSPAFINALLDKIMKSLVKQADTPAAKHAAADAQTGDDA